MSSDIAPEYLSRIQSLRPDLSIDTGRQINDGGMNVVAIVNDAWVFRFVRHESGRQALTNELRVFELLRNRVDLALPDPVIRCDDAIVYRLIEGEPMTSWLLSSYDNETQQQIADQLSSFLRQMHSIPSEGDRPIGERDWCAGLREEMKRVLYPHMTQYQRSYADYLLDGALRNPDFFDHTPVLINNDIHAYHILIDTAKRRINGLIDFGQACYGNPGLDFACLLQYYGESFVERLLRTYPEATAFLPYARWVALLNELEWVMCGIVENRVTWHFRAHLGINHDIRLPF